MTRREKRRAVAGVASALRTSPYRVVLAALSFTSFSQQWALALLRLCRPEKKKVMNRHFFFCSLRPRVAEPRRVALKFSPPAAQ